MIEFAAALATAVVLGAVARWAGPRVGALDRPDSELKPHPRPVSFLGGLAVAGAVAVGLGVEGWPLPAGVAVAVFGPAALGLLDDRWTVRAPIRLAVQAAFGVAMVAAGLSATALPGKPFAWAAAVVFYVTAMNAVNLVDGMDGLAAGTAAISAGGIAIVAAGESRPGVLALALTAAALGFLVHNLPPARLFLGDNGAYLVGATLAVAALQTGKTVPALAGAASCLGLFLLDLVLAIVRRVSGRAPLFAGDRGHVYDQLLARGLTIPACLAACYAIDAALVVAGVVAARLGTAGALTVTGAAWAVALVGLFAFGFVGYRPAVIRR